MAGIGIGIEGTDGTRGMGGMGGIGIPIGLAEHARLWIMVILFYCYFSLFTISQEIPVVKFLLLFLVTSYEDLLMCQCENLCACGVCRGREATGREYPKN